MGTYGKAEIDEAFQNYWQVGAVGERWVDCAHVHARSKPSGK